MTLTPSYIKRLKERIKRIEIEADKISDCKYDYHKKLFNLIKQLAGYIEAIEE